MADTRADARGQAGRSAVRVALAVFMVVAGISHFATHESFLQQLPTWLPGRSWIVWITGVGEVALGVGLVAVPRWRRAVGWALAIFLVAVFPGNVYQAVAGTDAFGLDSQAVRWLRLPFQPALVFLALWGTGAWPRRPRPVRT